MENKAWPCIECRVMMVSVNEDYCKCPVCGTEVWYHYDAPDLDETEPEIGNEPLVDTTLVSRSLPERYKVPPGGGKASGKKPRKKGTKTYLDNGYEG